MSDPTPEHQADEIKKALLGGNKIMAIKLYREQTGLGLKEAKDAMDKLEAELRTASPEDFSKSARAGCMSLILAGGVVIWWMFA